MAECGVNNELLALIWPREYLARTTSPRIVLVQLTSSRHKRRSIRSLNPPPPPHPPTATHGHLTVVRVRGRELYQVKSFHRNKLLIWSGIAQGNVPVKVNQRKLSWFESLPFAFLSLFFFGYSEFLHFSTKFIKRPWLLCTEPSFPGPHPNISSRYWVLTGILEWCLHIPLAFALSPWLE